ncbi:SDR family oxidoreductase [bacterium]|nr:SDR family oxidoreductase [bacterium]
MIILITGDRKGIGRYLSEYYLEKGITVIGCSRSETDLKHKNYQHFCLDVSDEQAVKKMYSQIRQTHGRLDVLINNAGVDLSFAPILLVPYKSALRTVEINLLGTFLMSREAAKIMMKNSFGRIINFSSMLVKHEIKGTAIYTASKSAIISFTRVMAKEVYGYNITCNIIAPSAIKTDLMDSVDKDVLKDILKRNAIQELCKTEDISNTIDWFIKTTSNSITGQIIYMGGA